MPTAAFARTALACCASVVAVSTVLASGLLLSSVLATELFGPAPIGLPVGDAPVALAVADLDGDGATDLAVANGSEDSVSVLLGDGLGGFVAATD